MNKRDLKAYSRFDGTGRIVPGSTVLRRQKPKVGKWIETTAYECCNVDQQPRVVSVMTAFPFNYPDFLVNSNDSSPYILISGVGDDTTVNNLEELAAYNNSRYSAIGKFTVNSGQLFYTPSINIANLFAANGTTNLAAYAYKD